MSTLFDYCTLPSTNPALGTMIRVHLPTPTDMSRVHTSLEKYFLRLKTICVFPFCISNCNCGTLYFCSQVHGFFLAALMISMPNSPYVTSYSSHSELGETNVTNTFLSRFSNALSIPREQIVLTFSEYSVDHNLSVKVFFVMQCQSVATEVPEFIEVDLWR